MNTSTLVRDILKVRKDPPIHTLLNLWGIDGDVLVGVDLQMTRVYRLTCPDASFFGEDDADRHATALGRLLDSLPPNCTAQLLVQLRWDGGRALDAYEAAKRPEGEMARFVLSERTTFLKRRAFRRVTHYLALTTHATPQDRRRFNVGPLSMRLPDPAKTLSEVYRRRIFELGTICNNALTSLREARVAAEALSGEALMSYFYERLNPGRSAVVERPAVRPHLTLRDQVALNACQSEFDTLTMDGHHHRAIHLHIRPSVLDGRAMHRLYNELSGDYDFMVSIDSVNQEDEERSLKSKGSIADALEVVHVSPYHEAKLQKEDADALLAHTKAEDQKLYIGSVHVVLRDSNPERLTNLQNETIQAFKRLDDAVAVVADNEHLPLFLASLPGHSHLNQHTETWNTEIAARFMTATASWDGSPNPQVVIPCDDGKLLGLDLFSSEITAKHSLILGVSGEGKSVLTNTLLTSFFCADEDNHVIVIDDGGSYRRLCELLGGQYLEPTLDGKYAFNPFLSPDHAFDASGQLDADFTSFMTLLVQMMVRRPDLTNNQKTIIEKCLLGAYEKAKPDAPLLGHLREAFGRFEGDAEDVALARSFYKELAIWTEGIYSRLLNRQSTFNASARFVVFDLNRMTQDDLKPVILLIIRSVIHPKLANKRLRKVIALDECWKFLAMPMGAAIATELYKTGRRFNAAVSVITQSAEDLLKSTAAAAIADNSTVKWILNLGGGYDKLAELKLSPEEIQVVMDLGKNPNRNQYRKVYLRFGERKLVIRNVLSPTAYWLYTTDPQDLRCELALKEKEPSWTPVKVLGTLGALKDKNSHWGPPEYLAAIAAGRY